MSLKGIWLLADIMESILFVQSERWTHAEPTEQSIALVKSEKHVLWTRGRRLVDEDFSNPNGFIRALWTDDYNKTHCL